MSFRFSAILFPILLFSCESFALGVTSSNQRMSTTKGLTPTGCFVPPSTTSFLTTDGIIYLYFEAATVASDRLTSDWLAPDGAVINGASWSNNAGNYCYADASLNISNTPANRLGTWQARVYANGTLLFTVPFNVAKPGTAISSDVITTVAGGGWRPFPKSQIPAASAPIGTPWVPVLDTQGNIYVPDSYNNVVVQITPDGSLFVVAGNSNAGFGGDGGPATDASLNSPTGVAVDAAGNLYIADQNNQRIRMVSNGIITTIAGTGQAGFSGDGGPATAAKFDHPFAVAVDSAGNLYVVDRFNRRVREISGGTITTIAGTGFSGATGDNGPATKATLDDPRGIALDSAGNLYVADYGTNRVREISGGTITTIAGNGTAGFSGDQGPATAASLNHPQGIAVDGAGQVFIADYNNVVVRKVSAGIITTVAGTRNRGFSGDGGPALNARFAGLSGVGVDGSGQLYIADFFNGRIRRVSNGIITTVAGNGSGTVFGDSGPATSAALLNTDAVAVDGAGNIYITDTGSNQVRKVSGGVITTVAGTGAVGFSGDGGPATSATLDRPEGLAVDAAGNLYIADSNNSRIRKVSNGIITTVAGNNTAGFSGDGGPATSASLRFPYSIALDGSGNLYIADSYNHRIRKVSGGTITTIAGNGTAGFSGDGGAATSASLNTPLGIAVDSANNIYIADAMNNRIRQVAGGNITTFAGNGKEGHTGDLGPATSASLDLCSVNAGCNWRTGLAIDGSGNLLIADYLNFAIRRVSGGTISTVVGNSQFEYAGDGGPAVRAGLSNPSDVTVDANGTLYIADTFNYRVRAVLNSLPSYQVSSVSLSFSASAGGSAPDPQTVSLLSMIPGLGFTASVSGNAKWLSATPANGTIPASLQVSVDPGSLAPGNYQGTITVSTPFAATSATIVKVTFSVQAAIPPQLSLGTQNLSFTALQGRAPQTAQLQIANAGGGSLPFSATVSTTTGGGWLSLSSMDGTATPGAPAALTVTADPGSLDPGTYSGNIAISGAGTTANVAVTLSVSSPVRSILLPQSGLTFTAVAQGGIPLPQTFGILNSGQDSMDWSASAATTDGGNWLNVSPANGTVVQPNQDVSNVSVSIDPTGLAPGDYYGQIQVSAAAVNSPQLMTVVLTVLPPGTTPGPEIRPTGLIFTGVAGSSPGSQDVLIGNPKPDTDSYLSANIGKGFTYLPTNASVLPNQPATLRVFPDFSQLQPGDIQRGTITLQFADGTPRNVSVLIVVAPPGTSSARIGARAGTCNSTQLQLQWRSPMQSFSATIGQPLTVEAQVIDGCGNLITNPKSASLRAAFSNKDTDISLTHTGNGVWTGTWRPVNPAAGTVAITLTGFNSPGSVIQSGQISISGHVNSGTTPVVTSSGVVHAASYIAGVPIAPGSLITIKGSNLSDAEGNAGSLPWPQLQYGTQVLLGNLPLPLSYTSTGQINVQVPFNTPVNTQYQVIVQRDNSLSVPEQLVIAAAMPGVFTVNEQGSGQGVIFKSDGATLAQPGTPATAGENITIYCTGLGVVDPPVPEGAPAPDFPMSNTVNPVTVNIGGQNAQVTFAGLAPGAPGRYQINAVVPDAVSGDAVPLTVTVAGQTSPPVTLAIQ